MNYLNLILGGVVFIYVGAYCLKSFLFYRRCVAHERSGEYVERDGIVSVLHEEKKKAVQGVLVSVSYPGYNSEGGKAGELKYTSVVKRLNVNVGDKILLFHNKASGLIWADGDLILLKKQMFTRLLIMLGLVGLLFLSSVVF